MKYAFIVFLIFVAFLGYYSFTSKPVRPSQTDLEAPRPQIVRAAMQEAAKKTGVQVVDFKQEGRIADVRIEWTGHHAKGGDFVDEVVNTGTIMDLEVKDQGGAADPDGRMSYFQVIEFTLKLEHPQQ